MKPSRHHLAILAAMAAFSLMAFFTRQAGVPFLCAAAWRAVLVALVFAVWTVLASPERWSALKVDRPTLKLGAIYGVALALASSTFVGGYALTTVANTIFLHNLAPLVAFPLAWWVFREKPSSNALSGAVLAVLGVALLSGVSLFQAGHYASTRFLLGDALALLSAVGYAGVLVLTRLGRLRGAPILPTLTVAWSVSALLLLPLALVTGQLSIGWTPLLWIAGLAVISTNLPFYLLTLGMRQVGAGTSSVLANAEVIFATLLGWLVFGELPSPMGWIGGLVVVLGLAQALFGRADAEEEPASLEDALSPATRLSRQIRLGLALLLLNAGALLLLLQGVEAAAILVWGALLAILRLGQASLASFARGRLGAPRWILGLLGAGLILALVLGRSWRVGAGASLALLLVALVGLLAERLLIAREAPAEREPGSLSLVLLLLGLSAVFGGFDHPAASWLRVAAALVVAGGAFAIVQDAMSARLPWSKAPPASASARLDALLASILRPRRGLAFLGLLWVAGGVHTLPPGSVGIVERLGRPLDPPAEAGLLLRLPPPVERVTVVDRARIRRLELVEKDLPVLCGDHSLVTLRAVLQYRVSDARAFTFEHADPEAALKGLARAALAAQAAHLSQDALLTSGRRALEDEVRAHAQARAEELGLGVELLSMHLSSVTVPAPVLASFLDVITADEERRTRVNLAEAYEARVLPRAFGEAVAHVEKAKGQAELRLARAEGERAWLEAIAEGTLAERASSRLRLRLDSLESAFTGRPIVLALAGRRLFLGQESLGPLTLSEAAAPLSTAGGAP